MNRKTGDRIVGQEQPGSLVAQFGDARLVRRLNGAISLRGGSPADRAEAHDWIVRFLREAYVLEKASRAEAEQRAAA